MLTYAYRDASTCRCWQVPLSVTVSDCCTSKAGTDLAVKQVHASRPLVAVKQSSSQAVKQSSSKAVKQVEDSKSRRNALVKRLVKQVVKQVQASHLAMLASRASLRYVSIRQHTSAYVSICQHMSTYVSIREHMSADAAHLPFFASHT